MAWTDTVIANDFTGRGMEFHTFSSVGSTGGSGTSSFHQIYYIGFSPSISGTCTAYYSGNAGTYSITVTSGECGNFVVYGA